MTNKINSGDNGKTAQLVFKNKIKEMCKEF